MDKKDQEDRDFCRGSNSLMSWQKPGEISSRRNGGKITEMESFGGEFKRIWPLIFERKTGFMTWNLIDSVRRRMRRNRTWEDSVQFSHSVLSDYLCSYGLQHTRPPCPSPTPGVCSNSCPLSQWCHLTISSSVVPFSSCLQSFPASGSFQTSQFFASCGQSIRVSASASVLPINIQEYFL